jgi:hypothetical protein
MPKRQGESMSETIQHETYQGIDIRSHPCEVTRQNKSKWKIRLAITFPTGSGTATATEYLDDVNFYSTLHEAHAAGFRWGHHIIDEWLRTGDIPSPRLASGLRRL